MISYAVVIERASDGGYGAWCPDLPGCVALADTEDAVLAEMRQRVESLFPASIAAGDFVAVELTAAGYARMAELVVMYGDIPLGTTDAS